MAHAIRGGQSHRDSLILSKALLFWVMFALLGIGGIYGVDHVVDPSADQVSLALPNDGQLEGNWASGPLRLQAVLRDRAMIVELWRDGPHSRQIATFLLDRGAAQGPLGLRHRFVSRSSNEVALSLTGRTLTLELPAKHAGEPARILAFHRL